MAATDYGKSGLALMIAGSADQPQWCGIGNGSGTFNAATGSLFAELLSARKFWATRDIGINKKVTAAFDFGSTTMSGIPLREFGVGAGSTIDVSDLWLHEHFPAITFDGTNETQIEVTFEVF